MKSVEGDAVSLGQCCLAYRRIVSPSSSHPRILEFSSTAISELHISRIFVCVFFYFRNIQFSFVFLPCVSVYQWKYSKEVKVWHFWRKLCYHYIGLSKGKEIYILIYLYIYLLVCWFVYCLFGFFVS
jgi:hypothetical protein